MGKEGQEDEGGNRIPEALRMGAWCSQFLSTFHGLKTFVCGL